MEATGERGGLLDAIIRPREKKALAKGKSISLRID